MRYCLFLLFLLICICHGFSGFRERVGNPDDTEIIERPCPVYDIECIREFFYEHSKCIKTYGPVPDPYVKPQTPIYNPRTNMTLILINQAMEGLNGRVEEFYINKDTNNIVIAIEFRNLTLTSFVKEAGSNIYFKYHRVAKEPVVTLGQSEARYDSLVVTAIIPNYENIQLDKAESTVFSNTAAPLTIVTPSASESDDTQVQTAMAEFIADLATNVQEQFLNFASFYITVYLQYNICDFGLLIV